eukprot:CAMPEP_0176088410 /NCGR_PEP_ID=MMETSP0120_2-20121206/44267_1 /TAXON_ID=160619 /ORGANISM="Kryptoperidinium foliaceum, Strain CCMP 1326" /LENGTH=41 /DNA_ID= /DNA_START= /DNA_END= /DNA_ORIENTATION=
MAFRGVRPCGGDDRWLCIWMAKQCAMIDARRASERRTQRLR